MCITQTDVTKLIRASHSVLQLESRAKLSAAQTDPALSVQTSVIRAYPIHLNFFSSYKCTTFYEANWEKNKDLGGFQSLHITQNAPVLAEVWTLGICTNLVRFNCGFILSAAKLSACQGNTKERRNKDLVLICTCQRTQGRRMTNQEN